MPASSSNTRPLRPGADERQRLRQALVLEACQLGLRIAQGDDAGIPQHETTITETVLLNLHNQLGHQLDITMLTQADEGVRGADWIWCVGGERGWFSFYVQAKKFKSNGYDVGYRSSQNRPQVDKLIAAAEAAGVNPVYVFYNPLVGGSSYSGASCVDALAPGADGFTAVSAYAARSLLEGSSRKAALDEVWWIAHPWACLAGCPDGQDRLRWASQPWPSPAQAQAQEMLSHVRDLWSRNAPGPEGSAGSIARLFAEQAIYAYLRATDFRGDLEITASDSLRVGQQASWGFSREMPAWVGDPDGALELWRRRTALQEPLFGPGAVVKLQVDDA
ncbi:hypothetical protein GCM10027063_36820 [Promicromonospora xylanilytica]